MKVFSSDTRTVEMWGPTASVSVKVAALSDVVGDSWLLSNMQAGAKEIVDVRQCFNDVAYIYALGNDQSKCTMTLVFTILIGRKNCSGSHNTANIKKGFKAYDSNRISQKTSPQSIAIGNFSGSGWLVGIDIGGVDPTRGICQGTAHFIIQM